MPIVTFNLQRCCLIIRTL